jgi:hypothetical protein
MTTTATRTGWALAGALLFAPPAAGGNELFVSQAGASGAVAELVLQQGQSVTLGLRMDFLDTTVGGGASLVYEPALLRLDAVRFDEALGDDPALRCAPATPTPCPGHPTVIAFGGLNGIAGARGVATLELTALASATTGVGVAPGRPFSDTTGRPLEVVLVPEPSAPMLMAAALVQLLLLQRWRTRRCRRAVPGIPGTLSERRRGRGPRQRRSADERAGPDRDLRGQR